MPKSLMVYFSQGGTTARVAESIATGLRGAGVQADLCNLKEAQPPKLDGYDVLGVGLPVYIYRPPFNVLDYLKGLPGLGGLPAFVFVVYGTKRGDAGTRVRLALAKKGAREVGYFCSRGVDYFLGYVKRGYMFSPGHPTAEELAAAEAFGQEVAARTEGKAYSPPKMDGGPGIVYRVERLVTDRWIVNQVYSRLFMVDRKKCTACGLCMKVCPVHNIREDNEGRPIWGQNCLFCVHCELKCPADAITSPMSWPIMAPFMIYNVQAAARDPSLDYARVTHRKGRTQLLAESK